MNADDVALWQFLGGENLVSCPSHRGNGRALPQRTWCAKLDLTVAVTTTQHHMQESASIRLYDQSVALMTGGIVLILTASIAVVLRLVSRRLKRLPWAVDDHVRNI